MVIGSAPNLAPPFDAGTDPQEDGSFSPQRTTRLFLSWAAALVGGERSECKVAARVEFRDAAPWGSRASEAPGCVACVT